MYLYSAEIVQVGRTGGASPDPVAAVTAPWPAPFAIVVAQKPLSANRGARSSSRYTSGIRNTATHQGAPILTGPLYARITWFQRIRTPGDVDNIAKLILDSLKGVVFQDDDDIVRCLIQKTVADATGRYLYDPSQIPAEALQSDLQTVLGVEDHVLYIEVGSVMNPMVSFGPVI